MIGYQKTFPRYVVFGTKYSDGLGLTKIKAKQTAAKICITINTQE